jgi:asparagine synthase (glutamine-hydrolysing)
MCGIVGIVAPEAGQYGPQLQKMLAAISHRGPDASGEMLFANCALGHQRLSIVDLSPTGAQPMRSAGDHQAITFNGEIYNHKYLRQSFGGYPFRGTSDTEVILAANQMYGKQTPQKLKGMFAYAIWDEAAHCLTAARDRFGEKPFYYAFGLRGEFVFASEIKAILASGLVEPKLSGTAVAHYLQRLYVHPTTTIYQNIYTLPPAHVLTFAQGKLDIMPYWQPPVVREVSMADAALRLQQLLDQAVSRQLEADVPVGAFLSGGLDSSSIVALASQHVPQLKTFSFGFGTSINELPYARELAARYHTEHLELQAGDYNLAELLWQMQEVYDEPFADSSNIPTFLIAKAAAQHLKVILTGDGADELLGGYSFWYRELYELQQQNETARQNIAKNIVKKILGRAIAPLHPLMARHDLQNTYFTPDQIAALMRDGTKPPIFWGGKDQHLDNVLRWDVADYMPGDILVKTDRASMAHGLELRAPFLDVDVAEFCLSLPYSLKINDRTDKWVLREAVGNLWTEQIRQRSKQGFGAPVAQWLQRPDFQELIANYLIRPDRKIFAYLDHSAVSQYAKVPDYRTWVLLVLSLWLEKHLS